MGLLTKKRESKALNTNLTYSLTGEQWLTPNNHSNTYIDGYKKLPNLYGIISLITQKSSIVPFEVMRVKNKGAAQKYKSMIKAITAQTDYKKIMKVKEQAYEVIPNSEIEELLLKPNSKQSMEELNEAFDGYLLLTGNAYLMASTPGIGKNATKPSELHVLPSTMTEPISENLEVTKYKVEYYPNHIEAEYVGHAKYFNPITSGELAGNQLIGLSPLTSCRNLIKKYESADIAQGSMFTNMGPAGILSGEGGELTEDQAVAVQDRFDQNRTGVDKANKIAVTPVRMHWTQIGLSPVDLDIIAGKEEMLAELCNVYHLDIGIVSGQNSTDNNMDNARKRTITDAVIPVVEKRKQVYNNWLAPKFGEDIVLVPDYSIFPEMQEDLKQQAEIAGLAWWLTPSERRELTGYDVDATPAMNKYYIPSGLTPIEDLSLDIEDADEEILDGLDA